MSNSTCLMNSGLFVLCTGLLLACSSRTHDCPTDTCSNTPSQLVPSGFSASNAPIGRSNLLSLAAPSVAPLNAPWDGRDTGLLNLLKSRQPQSEQVLGAVVEVTVPCSGGGTQTDLTDNVAPPWFSEGDRYETIYSDCVVADTRTNGRRGFSVDIMTGQAYVDPNWTLATTISRDLTRTNLLNNETTFAIGNASEQMTVSNITTHEQLLSGNSNRSWINNGVEQVATEQYQVTYSWDETSLVFSWDFDVASSSTLFGDSTAVSLQTLTGTMGLPPEAGKFQSSETFNGVTSISTITATGGGAVTVELDSNGDGIVDSTTSSTWAELILNPALLPFP